MLRIFLLAMLAIPLGPVMAAGQSVPPDPTEDPLMITAGFLSAHPDLRYRLLGLQAYEKQEHQDALGYFRRAALYADKPSQGMVGEMLWNGVGVTQDRALGYAWMDLAAERGYRGFLILRERYWNQLDAAARERAIREGEAVYARYGDAAAKPRIARELRRGRHATTGSRTGFVGNLQIVVPGPAGPQTIDGSKFYDPRYWDPDQYAAWHDAIWMKPAIGRVDVGGLETVQDEPAPASRIPENAPDNDARKPEVPADPTP
ncbi:MAG: hypothetical protein M3374_05415 [Pseudomonadota bacterium]|nr:hypothetical protein [Pseudomonadota bacterium]